MLSAPAFAAIGSTTSPPSARAGGSYAELSKGYSCEKDYVDSHGNQISECANITWRRANIVMDGPISVRMRNRTSSKQELVCRWDQSTSWSFSASVSSEIEAGVIFARAKVTISGSVSYTKTVSTGTSVNVTVKPHSTAWCKSGVAMPEFGGNIRSMKCASTGYCGWIAKDTYTAEVPKQLVWDIVERPLR